MEYTEGVTDVVEKRTPRVGDKVLVQHRTKLHKNGSVGLEAAPGHITTVKAVMLDGDVKTNQTDLWRVVPSKDGKADWMTAPLPKVVKED